MHFWFGFCVCGICLIHIVYLPRSPTPSSTSSALAPSHPQDEVPQTLHHCRFRRPCSLLINPRATQHALYLRLPCSPPLFHSPRPAPLVSKQSSPRHRLSCACFSALFQPHSSRSQLHYPKSQ